MEESESPVEQLQEEIQHHASHGGHETNEQKAKLVNRAALLSAIVAVLAAISSAKSGRYANEAMIDQMRASDHWAYYQAKGIKASIAQLKENLGHETKSTDDYRADQEKIKEQAEAAQETSEVHLKLHESWALAVTFFQISIALIAITILTKRRRFFAFAGAVAVLGVIMIVRSIWF